MTNTKTKTPKEKPKYNMAQNVAFMVGRAWRVHKSIIFVCVLLAALAVASNLVNLFIAPLILAEIEAGASLSRVLTVILALVLARLAITAVESYTNANKGYTKIKLRMTISHDIMDKQLTTAYPNTQDRTMIKMAEKAQTATSSNSQPTEAIWQTLTDILKNCAGFVIYLCMMAALDPVLMAVVCATAVIGYFVNRRINAWNNRHRDEEQEIMDPLYYLRTRAEIREFGKDIRLFGMRDWLEELHVSYLGLLDAFILKHQKIVLWANLINLIMVFLRNGVAYFFLIHQTLEGNLPASYFLLYFNAVGGFSGWISGILGSFVKLHEQSLKLSVVREYLDAPEPFRFEDGEPLKAIPNHAYAIELRNVSFRYPGAEADTLHGVNLTIRPGERLAVVGLNGAGKTTLVKLICGFYDPTEGEVLLDGVDIRRYNRRDYYALFAAVFQQFSLLEASIAENIAQTVEGIDREKVAACIEQAGLTAKIAALPKQLDTHLGRELDEDGVELSGGETQRLMLARALYKDAPILVLDEPTAALDPLAEHDIYCKYDTMTTGRTSVYISHRLASTRFCDRILYIADGGIAEEGTHDSLLAAGGKYAELFAVQSRYYQEGAKF